VFSLRRPSEARLDAVIAKAAAAGFSYSEVGATAGEFPARYRHDRWSTDLGEDAPDRLDHAATELLNWRPQRGADMTLHPDEPVSDGFTFALTLQLPGGGYAVAPGRVVYVIDEPHRRGFAYGTLVGHPEQGEESFIVKRADGRLVFEITAFSKPSHPLARIGGPLTRRFQLLATKRYLAAMREAA